MLKVMTSKRSDVQNDEPLPAANTIQHPVKSSRNADPNLANTTTDEDDIVSVMSNGTATTKERSCCSDHDGSESDHECDGETADTSCSVKSILKEPEADWASIRSEGPWKRLSEPVLPMGPLRERPKIRHQRSVSFDSVKLRKYSQTVGDNPCVSYGPPIQLDWKYEEEELAFPIDEYESRERKWRYRQQMVMNAYKRKSLLTFYYGFTEEELKKSEKMVQKIQWQRHWTKVFEPFYIMEDVLSTTYRRIKVYARKRRGSRRNSL